MSGLSVSKSIPSSPLSSSQPSQLVSPKKTLLSPPSDKTLFTKQTSEVGTLLSSESMSEKISSSKPSKMKMKSDHVGQLSPGPLKLAVQTKQLTLTVEGTLFKAKTAGSYNEALELLQTAMDSIAEMADLKYAQPRKDQGQKLILVGGDIVKDKALTKLICSAMQIAGDRHLTRELGQIAKTLNIPLSIGVGGTSSSVSDKDVAHIIEGHVNVTPSESLKYGISVFSHEFLPRGPGLAQRIRDLAEYVVVNGEMGEVFDSAQTGEVFDFYLNEDSRRENRIITGWAVTDQVSDDKATGHFYKGIVVRGRFDDSNVFHVETMFPKGIHDDVKQKGQVAHFNL